MNYTDFSIDPMMEEFEGDPADTIVMSAFIDWCEQYMDAGRAFATARSDVAAHAMRWFEDSPSVKNFPEYREQATYFFRKGAWMARS